MNVKESDILLFHFFYTKAYMYSPLFAQSMCAICPSD